MKCSERWNGTAVFKEYWSFAGLRGKMYSCLFSYIEKSGDMIKEYVLQNWPLILILAAFAISLGETVFLDKKTVRRMYILIAGVFVLSVLVFVEFYLADLGQGAGIRIILMAIRYSATPFIIALVIYTHTKKLRWYVFIPAIVFAAVNIISIFTGIVFGIDESGTLRRGPLGMMPFIAAGLYCIFLLYILIKRSNRQTLEIIPITFLALAFTFGLIFPFVYGSDYSHIFCITIAIALYVYYVFSILQMTKKDSLTGLLNRQAFYSDIDNDPGNISAMISIDMNGLKDINDQHGHIAGDEALVTVALCFMRALKRRQQCYRTGGDEFVIVCRKTPQNELLQILKDIKNNLAETEYSCAIGCSHITGGAVSVAQMLQQSDEMMYAEKALYYSNSRRDRRHR